MLCNVISREDFFYVATNIIEPEIKERIVTAQKRCAERNENANYKGHRKYVICNK